MEWQTFLPTLLGALLGGGIVLAGQWWSQKHQRQLSSDSWKRERAAARADDQQRWMVEAHTEVNALWFLMREAEWKGATESGLPKCELEHAQRISTQLHVVRMLASRISDADLRNSHLRMAGLALEMAWGVDGGRPVEALLIESSDLMGTIDDAMTALIALSS